MALIAFLLVAWLVSSVGEITRARAREGRERTAEADLAREMAGLLLRGGRPRAGAARGGGEAGAVVRAAVGGDRDEGRSRGRSRRRLRAARRRSPVGTLIVGKETSERSLHRLQERMVPALEALLSAALERESLLGEVVETAALRQADVVEDRAAAGRVSRPALATDRDLHGGRGDRAPHALGSRARGARLGDRRRAPSSLAPGRVSPGPLASGGGGGAAAPRVDVVEEVIGAAMHELGGCARGVSLLDRPRPACRAGRLDAGRAGVRERARERALPTAAGIRCR